MTMFRFLGFVAFVFSIAVSALAEGRLTGVDVTAGHGLAATAHVLLSEPAPAGGLRITVTSANPDLILLSSSLDAAGSKAIVVTVQDGFKRTPDFYVYGMGSSGSTTYLASAKGYGDCSATVTFAPSGIVVQGTFGLGNPMLITTGSDTSSIKFHSAILGPSGAALALQPVAGRPLSFEITNSNPQIGTIAPSSVTIPAGLSSATAKFKAIKPGKTTLSVVAPGGFAVSPQHGTVSITAITPGISITDQVAIGRDLQIGGTLALGQPAPPEGVRVTLTSNNAKALLLSRSVEDMGAESITIDVPGGESTALFHLQSTSDSGTATYVATAPGYAGRTGTVHLTPSGIVIGLEPPDEAEVFRKEAAESPKGISVSLSKERRFPLSVYMVQLDPKTLRGADITVQALRPGVTATVQLKSTDSTVGTIEREVCLKSGASSITTPFSAQKEGTTVISAATPEGFTPAKNSTSLTVIVRP